MRHLASSPTADRCCSKYLQIKLYVYGIGRRLDSLMTVLLRIKMEFQSVFQANFFLLLNWVPGPGVGAERGGVRQPGRGAAATLHSPATAAHEAGAAVRALVELPEGLVVHGSLEWS